MAQLFDPMLEPGTVIDEETGMAVPVGLDTEPQPQSTDIAVDVPSLTQMTLTPETKILEQRSIPDVSNAPGVPSFEESQQIDPATNLPIGPFGPTSAPDLDRLRYEFGYRAPVTQEKIGTEAVSKSQKEMPEQTKTALTDIEASGQRLKAAEVQERQGLAEEQKAQSDLDKKVAETTAKWKLAEADRIRQENNTIAKLLNDADMRQAELAKMERKDFWGSQTEGQKWATALSVGLGSFGQALTGSGQNVGIKILNSRIDQFNRIQDQQFEQKKKEIEGLRISASKRQEAIAALEKEFDARKLSEISKIEEELKPRIAAAKTPQMQAKLTQTYEAMQQQKARSIADIADKYAAQTSENRTTEIYRQVSGKASYLPPNVEAAKAGQQWVTMATAFQPMQEQFKQNKKAFDTPETRNYYASMLGDEAAASVSQFGGELASKAIDSIATDLSSVFGDKTGMAQARFAEANPEAYNFFQRQRQLAAGLIRGDTGAAITAEEWRLAYDMYLVLPWDTPERAEEKMRNSAARLQLMGKQSGLL
jgi:hypothetical protein